jgi:hypothetical protein
VVPEPQSDRRRKLIFARRNLRVVAFPLGGAPYAGWALRAMRRAQARVTRAARVGVVASKPGPPPKPVPAAKQKAR